MDARDCDTHASSQQVHISWTYEYGKPMIIVLDNGIGMTREEMKRCETLTNCTNVSKGCSHLGMK